MDAFTNGIVSACSRAAASPLRPRGAGAGNQTAGSAVDSDVQRQDSAPEPDRQGATQQPQAEAEGADADAAGAEAAEDGFESADSAGGGYVSAASSAGGESAASAASAAATARAAALAANLAKLQVSKMHWVQHSPVNNDTGSSSASWPPAQPLWGGAGSAPGEAPGQ